MKKTLLFIPLLIALVTTTGCSYIQNLDAARVVMYAIDSSVLISSLVKLDDTVTTARASINENKNKFSESDWTKLEIAGDQIDEIRTNFSRIFGSDVSITKRLMSGVQLKNVVGDVFDVYDDVEEIVLLHAEQFTEPQRLQVLVAKRTIDNLKDSYYNIKTRAENKNDTDPIDATDTIQRAVLAVQKIATVFSK